jgi:hypothetical protein
VCCSRLQTPVRSPSYSRPTQSAMPWYFESVRRASCCLYRRFADINNKNRFRHIEYALLAQGVHHTICSRVVCLVVAQQTIPRLLTATNVLPHTAGRDRCGRARNHAFWSWIRFFRPWASFSTCFAAERPAPSLFQCSCRRLLRSSARQRRAVDQSRCVDRNVACAVRAHVTGHLFTAVTDNW